ncbi:MAG TPA: tetratricopeptide repeat protein [Chitinophagales bacterium]|nr:tetratricopeptide repeat protein [Chitinophagales bacterium]
MAEKKPISTPQADIFTRAEDFFEHNKKWISFGISTALVLIVAVVAINNFYLPSREKEAQEQMFRAQQYFEKDSFRLALNGDGNYDGFLKIIDDYSWTKAACLSHYYAGISYLRLGEYDNAITHLRKFSTREPIVGAMGLGALGDAYSEKNDMDEAVNYYQKAAKKANNEVISPYYLLKAGLALKVKGKNEEALEVFKKIKSNYPESNEGKEIDKYIAMVS